MDIERSKIRRFINDFFVNPKKQNIDSYELSKIIGKTHYGLNKTIMAYKDDLKDLGFLTIRKIFPDTGRPSESFILNKLQCFYLLLLLRNNRSINIFKKSIAQLIIMECDDDKTNNAS